MGFSEFVDSVVDHVGDTVGRTAEWAEETARKLGLDKIADAAKVIGKVARKLTIAPTPILQGGQFIIEEMLDSAGDGYPDRGVSFADASRAFDHPLTKLAAAHPGTDWQGGTASAAYSGKTSEQENRVTTLADLDADMARWLSNEADQLLKFREVMEYWHQWLADFGSYSQFLGAGGLAGKALQAQFEAWAVGMAMQACAPRAWQMYNDAKDNAAAIEKLKGEYEKVADNVTISDSTGDFDPPKPPRRQEPPPAPAEPGDPNAPAPAPAPGGTDPVPAPTPGGPVAPAPAPGAPPAAPPRGSAPRTAPAASGGAGSVAPASTAGPRPAAPAPGPVAAAASGATGGRAPVAPTDEGSGTTDPGAPAETRRSE